MLLGDKIRYVDDTTTSLLTKFLFTLAYPNQRLAIIGVKTTLVMSNRDMALCPLREYQWYRQ